MLGASRSLFPESEMDSNQPNAVQVLVNFTSWSVFVVHLAMCKAVRTLLTHASLSLAPQRQDRLLHTF